MAKTALITGITGFIGSNLARRLMQDGWQVHAVVRADSNTEDLRDICGQCSFHVHDGSAGCMLDLMQSAKPDVVFHLASLFLADHGPHQVTSLIESNILFASQLAEAMIRTGCKRLINTGTSWQHYHSVEYRPVNLYAATKQAFEDILDYYHDAHDLSCITLKLFDTFGPNDKRRKLINLILESAWNDEPIGMSPGEQVIDMSHVDDVVDCFIEASAALISGSDAVNESYLVSGERMTVKELVALVSDALGQPIDASFGSRPYRAREVMELPTASDGLMFWKSTSAKRSLHAELAKLKKKCR